MKERNNRFRVRNFSFLQYKHTLMIKETVIPEMEICWKHVKKCSGSIVKAATERWKTIMYPLTETHICPCVSRME